MKVAKELVAINHVIAALEYAGFNVFMQHSHFVKDGNGDYPCYDGNPELPVKAQTVIGFELGADPSNLLFQVFGVALCSVKDQFSPVTGAQMAFTRAMDYLCEAYSREFIKEAIEDYGDYLEACEE